MSTPYAVALGILALILIAEIILSAKWNARYFILGLPIFKRRIERSHGLDDVSLDALAKSAATAAGTPLLFRRIAPGLILFREKAFGGTIHYFPLMRGVIRHSAEESSAVVLGIANWTFVAFVVLAAILLGKGFWIFMPYPAIAFAVLYLIQAVRYNRVAKALRGTQP